MNKMIFLSSFLFSVYTFVANRNMSSLRMPDISFLCSCTNCEHYFSLVAGREIFFHALTAQYVQLDSVIFLTLENRINRGGGW